MTLKIKSMSALSDLRYEAIFENDAGAEKVVRFDIEQGDVPAIHSEPDIFMRGEAYAKDIMAIVHAFHVARTR
jgi:hypothetical protein